MLLSLWALVAVSPLTAAILKLPDSPQLCGNDSQLERFWGVMLDLRCPGLPAVEPELCRH